MIMMRNLTVLVFLFSGLVFAAEEKARAVPVLEYVNHETLLTSLCKKIVVQWDEWQKRPEEEQSRNPSWQFKKEIGDVNDVRALFSLPHSRIGHRESRSRDECVWITSEMRMNINGKKDILVQDSLHVSTNILGNVVGRHIHMHRPIEDRGIYCVSAKPDSKKVEWHFTNGTGI